MLWIIPIYFGAPLRMSIKSSGGLSRPACLSNSRYELSLNVVAARALGLALIRSRGEGEEAVRAAFPQAVIVRPSVMFGPDDAFLMPLANLTQKLPIFPLFGAGETAL
jgi:uncharacterized protein YbjT (DUF2867 family)